MPTSPALLAQPTYVAHTSHVQRRARRIDPFPVWLAAARTAAFQRARKAGRTEVDAADISQEVALYAAEFGVSIMTAYPNPEVFAAVRTYHASIGWDRRDGSQSGTGAAYGRTKLSLSAGSGDGLGYDHLPASADDVDATVEGYQRDQAVRLLVATELDPHTARWVWDVKGHGLKVSAVARRDGVSREYVSRAVNAAVRQLQAVVGEFIGG